MIDAPLKRRVSERDLPALLDLIRQRTALVRGATHGTMLRNDIYDFARLGTFVERADNTGRILDVKYSVLLPTAYAVGSSMDNVHWDTILRSVGATPANIFALILLEAVMLLISEILLGYHLLSVITLIVDPILAADFGLRIGLQLPTFREALLIGLVFCCGLAASVVPALRVYRMTLADGLSMRL